MKRVVVLTIVAMLLIVPATSQAFLEAGFGLNNTTFGEDQSSLDSDNGTTLDVVFGDGFVRLMGSYVMAEPEGLDYKATMIGPAFVLDVGFDFRIYAMLSDHNLETSLGSFDGSGITLGGSFGFPVFPMASVAGDVRVSQWDASSLNIQAGTVSLLFRIGF